MAAEQKRFPIPDEGFVPADIALVTVELKKNPDHVSLLFDNNITASVSCTENSSRKNRYDIGLRSPQLYIKSPDGLITDQPSIDVAIVCINIDHLLGNRYRSRRSTYAHTHSIIDEPADHLAKILHAHFSRDEAHASFFRERSSSRGITNLSREELRDCLNLISRFPLVEKRFPEHERPLLQHAPSLVPGDIGGNALRDVALNLTSAFAWARKKLRVKTLPQRPGPKTTGAAPPESVPPPAP